jgi:uncharacterized protein (DUF1501 family)
VNNSTNEDYKALVCVFLGGGNDGSNMIIPFDNEGYGEYARQRESLALPQNGLLPIEPATNDGRKFALHPRLTGMKNLFETGKAAVIANVGTLVVPTTKTQYNTRRHPLPPNLFSHPDQTVHWQTSLADRPVETGWGGRAADLLNSLNRSTSLSMSICFSEANVFQIGSRVSQTSVPANGSLGLRLNGYDDNPGTTDLKSRAINQILALENQNLFENEFRDIQRNSIASNRAMREALANAPTVRAQFPGTIFGERLRMAARLIAARISLGFKRQIFFVTHNGFDTHSDQLETHSRLLNELSLGLTAFHSAATELGVAENVTAFTVSEFGRTYKANSSGSDHGWGNHHFVIGDAVRGGDIYGRMPQAIVGGDDDATTGGQWIPTTSVDEYSAPLARWFGVAESDMPIVLPNLGRFASQNLNFMM